MESRSTGRRDKAVLTEASHSKHEGVGPSGARPVRVMTLEEIDTALALSGSNTYVII